MDINRLRREIIRYFSSFWELNDKAHKTDHFEGVFLCGLEINRKLKLGYDPKLIMFAAYFHDMFAWKRDEHHELSYKWMKLANHPLIVEYLQPSEQHLVAHACHEHRASFKGEFSYEFCELINSADREMPGDVQHMLQRAIRYREKNHPEQTADERIVESIKHLKEKFGHGGYARYPEMYMRCFKEELEVQRNEIMAL